MRYSHSKITEFVTKNRRALPGMEAYFTKDTNQDRVQDWDKAKLKVLVVFASTASTRVVSNTFTCLNLLIHAGSEEWTDIFVDNSYMPEADTREAFIKEGIPMIFGSATHRSWEEYDVIMFSHSIMPECINFPYMMEKSSIPLTMELRQKENVPLIIYGGAASAGGFSILGGKVNDLGKGLYDIGLLGAGEVTIPPLVEELIKYNKSVKEDKADVIEMLFNTSIKDYLMIPNKYDVEIDPESNLHLKKITRLDSRTPEKVKVGRLHEPNFYGFYKKIFSSSGGNAKSSDVQISSGCTSGSCSFCSEGQEAGHWTEKDLEHVVSDLKKTRAYSAPNTIGIFSFNLNYYKSVFDLYAAEAEMFSNLSMINQRLDVIGAAPEYLELAKRMGLRRISAAIEGMGERIRNKILNKNLSFEQIKAGARQIYRHKLLMSKYGMIITGHEETEDFDAWKRELEEILAIREELGANTAIQISHCDEKGTLVPVKGKGLIPIEEVVVGDYVATYGEGSKWTRVKKTFINKPQKVRKIKSKRGFTKTSTLDHPYLTDKSKYNELSGYSFNKDLSIGDALFNKAGTEAFGGYKNIQVPRVTGTRNNSSEDVIMIDKEFGFMLGWLVGDGWIANDGGRVGYQFNREEKPCADRIAQYVESLGYKVRLKDDLERNNTFTLMVYSQEWNRILEGLGVGKGSHNKDIPKEILESPKEVQVEFLKGLFSSDGTATQRIGLDMTAQKVVEKAQIMLLNLGIVSSVYDVPQENRLPKKALVVLRHYEDKFADEVGFEGIKQEECKALLSERKTSRQTNRHHEFAEGDTLDYIKGAMFAVGGSPLDSRGRLSYHGDRQFEGLVETKNKGYKYLRGDLINKAFETLKEAKLTKEFLKGLATRRWDSNRLLFTVNLELWPILKEQLDNIGVGYSETTRKSTVLVEILACSFNSIADVLGLDNKNTYLVQHDIEGLVEDEVAEISDDLEEVVTYGFELESGIYLSNGIVSHNTPLVFYSTIPLRWMERRTARFSFYNEKTMGEMVPFYREKGIRAKYNGRGPGTYIEQLLLDLGFAGTGFLVDVSTNEGLVYERHFGDKAKEMVLRSLGKFNIDPTAIFPERPLDYLFSSDIIEFTTEKNLEMWKEQHKMKDFSVRHCLKTPANLTPSCRDCGFCFTPQEKLTVTKRKIESENKVSDIMELLSQSRSKSEVRVVVQLRRGMELYSKEMLAHYITSLFLRKDESIADEFYAVSKTTCSWSGDKGQKAWFGGKFAFDIKFKSFMDAGRLSKLVDEVNKELDTCRVVRVSESAPNLEPAIKDKILYMGEISNLSMSVLKDKMVDFDWNIKVAVKGMGDLETELQPHADLKDKILFVQHQGKVLCSMTLNANMNPYLVLSSITGRGLNWCYSNSEFSIMEHGQEVDASCSCGEPILYSHLTGETSSLCPTCTAKRYLYVQTRK